VRKINVLFDVTWLAEEDLKNGNPSTGVGVVVFNILAELLKRDELSISLYCSRQVAGKINGIKAAFNQPEIEVITLCDRHRLDALYKRLTLLFCGFYQWNWPGWIKKILTVAFCPILECLFRMHISLKDYSQRCQLDDSGQDLDKYDIFLSSIYVAPGKILNNKRIIKMGIIYDIIPLLSDHNKFLYHGWLRELIEAIRPDHFYFCISKKTADDLRYWLKEEKALSANCIVIPLATAANYQANYSKEQIDEVLGKYKIPLGQKIFFHVSSYVKRKNVLVMLKAFSLFCKSNKIDDCIFVLGGGGAEFFIKQNVKAFRLSGINVDNVITTGFIDLQDLPVLYNAAFLFSFVSTYEGFGLPVLEAMKCGCPVVTSSIDPFLEITDGTALTVLPSSEQQIADAYKAYYFDAQLRETNSKNGLLRSREYSWGKAADIIVNTMVSAVVRAE